MNERVYQSMRECDVFVCCIGVNVIVGECYSLTGAVDIANGVYRIQNAFNCMRPSSPHQKVKF